MFGWREAYSTFDYDNYVASKQALQDRGIDYRIKMQYRAVRHTGFVIQSAGRANINYRICVKKKDANAARHIFGRS